jgi:hypothetical protein
VVRGIIVPVFKTKELRKDKIISTQKYYTLEKLNGHHP